MKELDKLQLLSAKVQCEESIHVETGLVGATGDQYSDTQQLKVLNYKESMESPYWDKYQQGIDKE